MASWGKSHRKDGTISKKKLGRNVELLLHLALGNPTIRDAARAVNKCRTWQTLGLELICPYWAEPFQLRCLRTEPGDLHPPLEFGCLKIRLCPPLEHTLETT